MSHCSSTMKMEDKHQEVLPPSITAERTTYIDEESATAQSRELRRKKCIMWVAYIAAFIVFQTLIMVSIDLTIMRIRRPKYRLQSITITNLSISNATASPSFNMQLSTEVTFKNQNFGPYKFEYGYVTFSYKGTPVGEAVIDSSSAKTLSTKEMKIVLNITSKGVPRSSNLGSDIASDMLRLTSYSNLRGQVELMKVIKKDKSAIMGCNMIISLSRKVVEELNCD